MRILVVEDEPRLRELIERTLRGEGYEVDASAHGAEGFERARAGGYDVILLDVMLPVLAIAKKRGKMVKTSAGGRSARGDLRSLEDLEPDQPAAVPEVTCDASARSAG